MSNVIEANYSQQWLFPPSLEDLLPAGHAARLVREFVDALDLEKLGFQAQVAETGRPAYAVSLQIKVILYGYMNRVRSTRGWERACYKRHRNAVVDGYELSGPHDAVAMLG